MTDDPLHTEAIVDRRYEGKTTVIQHLQRGCKSQKRLQLGIK